MLTIMLVTFSLYRLKELVSRCISAEDIAAIELLITDNALILSRLPALCTAWEWFNVAPVVWSH